MRSAPGAGTAIRVHLPAAGSLIIETPSESPKATPPALDGVVVVIDDEDELRFVTTRMLERLGFRTAAASGGRAGLRLLEELGEEAAAIVLDLTMPDLPGAEVLRRIVASDPDAKVLLMSGYGEREAEDLLRIAPKARFMPKPFGLADLRSAMSDLGARAEG